MKFLPRHEQKQCQAVPFNTQGVPKLRQCPEQATELTEDKRHVCWFHARVAEGPRKHSLSSPPEYVDDDG